MSNGADNTPHGAPELQPCPFCGRKVPDDLEDTLYPSGGYWRETDGMRHYISHRDRKPGDHQCWTMHCGTGGWRCGAQITADSREEAIAAWNRRAAIQQAAGAVPGGSREAFEAHLTRDVSGLGTFLEATAKHDNGDYVSKFSQQHWLTWRAAKKHPEAGSSDHLVPCAGGGVTQPLTDEQIQPLYRQVQAEVAKLEDEGRYTFAGWFPVAVRLVEAAHGINPGSAPREDGHG